MAPSKESEALTSLFKQFAAAFPKEDNVFLERAIYDQVSQAASEPTHVSYEDTTITSNSLTVPCKWLKPEDAAPNHAILFLHGGGYSFGSVNSHRKMAAYLAKACGLNALMVEYRRTPEVAFPAPLEDCFAAYTWLIESHGVPAERIVVMGDSCGGGLSAAIPLMALQKGVPVPGLSVALSPQYDSVGEASDSQRTNIENDALCKAATVGKLIGRHTHDGKAAKADNPLVSPLFASDADLKKMPPTWISAAGYDTLLNDSTRMGERLKKVGVEVVVEISEGMQHVFEFLAGKAPEADKSIAAIGKWVKQKFAL